jgi:hypothetical protein
VSNKNQGTTVKSRAHSIIWLIVSIVGLWAGFFILNITGEVKDLGSGEKALRIVFAIVWFLFWIGAMVYNVLNLGAASRAKKAAGPGSPEKEDRS